MTGKQELGRLVAARGLATTREVETSRLLEALSEIVGLLDQETLLAGDLGAVDGEPVAILVQPEDEGGDAEAGERSLVVTATREGTLIWGVLETRVDGGLRCSYQEQGRQWVEGFNPDRDQILGLYWTRQATVFRRRRDLILVTQQAGALRVYEAQVQWRGEALRLLGDQVPDWMKVCPVGAPVGHDLLAEPPSQSPPPGATGAALLQGTLYSSARVATAGGASLEGESLHGLGDLLVLPQLDQFLECFQPAEPELGFQLVWRRRLEDQPVYACPLPEKNGRRCLLVGHETGRLSVLAVVGREEIRAAWQGLVEKLAENEKLTGFADWVRWARSRIGGSRPPDDHSQIAAVLRILLEKVPEDREEREREITEEAARLFRQPLSFDEFLPVMGRVREIMQEWASGRSCFAADAIEKVYSHLPYELQDLFDLELQRHEDGSVAGGSEDDLDRNKYRELLRHRHVNREKLFNSPKTEDLPRVALMAEEWLEPYVLDQASPCPQASVARLRALAVHRAALVIHGDALLLRRIGVEPPVTEVTPEGWSPASQSAFVVQRSGDRGPLLVAAGERKLALVAIPVAGGKAVHEHEYFLPSDRSLALAGDCGDGLVLLIVAGLPAWANRPEVWLYSLDRKEVVAKAELPSRVPRELAVLPAGRGKGWWLAIDVADDEVGLLKMTQKQGVLKLEEVARRRLLGRIRSAAALSGDRTRGSLLVVGTTEGYVAAFSIGQESPGFDLRWIYRTRGAIRHLDVLATEGQVYALALTAAGSALLFDGTGRRLWQRRLQSALRSGALLQDVGRGRVMPGLIDADGNVWIYRQTDPAAARGRAERLLPRVPEKQWAEDGTTRWEMADAMRLLARRPPAWSELRDFQTEAARACFHRYFGDWLDEGVSLDELRPVLADLVAASRPRELAVLARLPGTARPRRIREALVLGILQELAARTGYMDESEPGFENEVREVVAELVRGPGAAILVPSQLEAPDLEAWWRLPPGVHQDPWVLWNLLLSAAGEEPADRKLSALLEQATFLGLGGFKILPLLAPLADRGFAEALQTAMRKVARREWGLSEADLEALRRPPLKGEPAALACLLALLHDDQAGWDDLLALAAETERRPGGGFHPALTSLLARQLRFHEIRAGFGQRRVAEQVQVLDQLLAEDPPSLPDPAGIWADWLAVAGPRFQEVVSRILDERRKELRRWQWVRVYDLQVERISGRFAALRMRLQKDGRDRGAARVRLSVANPGEGMAPLEGENAVSWSWDEVKEELTWFGFLQEGATRIEVRSVTQVEQEPAHESSWTVEVPRREAAQGETVLEALPALRRESLAPVLALKKGFHLLSLDEDLGAQPVVSDLIQAKGTEVVELDDLLEALGPGRADPAGLTGDRILEALGARRQGTGHRWRIRAGEHRRILAYPAEETVTRLLQPGLGAVLERFRQGLAHLDGPPVLLVLPTELAAKAQGALAPHAHYRPLFLVGSLELSGEAAREVESWVAETAGIGKPEARAAWSRFHGHLRLAASWSALPKAERPEPEEYLLSPQAADTLRPELTGVGPREMGDLVIADRSRVRFPVRDLVTGMQAAQAVLSTPKSGSRTAIVTEGQELTDKSLSDIRSDPGRHQELWVFGYPPEGKNAVVAPGVKALHCALQRDAASVWRSHRLWAQRRILRTSGPLSHVTLPYRSWLEGQLAADPSGRGFIESMEGHHLLDSLTFRELAAAGDSLRDLCPGLPARSIALIRELGALVAAGGEVARLESLGSSLTGCRLRPLPVAEVDPALSSAVGELLGKAVLFKVDRPDPEVTHLLGYLSSAPRSEVSALAALLRRYKKVVLTLFGPGLPQAALQDPGDLCLLREENLKEVLRADDVPRAFWGAVRKRVGLVPFSPFQVGSHLDEHSPVFVGREQETQRILERLATTSFLILGGRQIGKTSLLRHCYGRIGDKAAVTRIWLDCAGLRRPSQFHEALRACCEKAGLPASTQGDPLLAVERTLRGLPSPVLFLNEVDGLMLHASDLMQRLRSLSEERVCQSVMVGYLRTFESLRQSDHPLYHWVQGEAGDKAFFLGALSESAARQLVDKLFDPPLELRCEDDQTRSQVYTTLIEVSHRIPFFLQGACQRLLQSLDEERRTLIRRRDVEVVMRTGQDLVWDYLRNTQLVPTATRTDNSTPEAAAWGDLVLVSLVRALFYGSELKPIDNPRLRQEPPDKFKFSIADTMRYVGRALKEQGLFEEELDLVERRFTNDSYASFVDAATLTVLMAPLPGGERTYYFNDYIYPIELDRYLKREKKSIDSHIFQLTADLLEILERSSTRRPPESEVN